MIILSEQQQVQMSVGQTVQLQHGSVGETIRRSLILVHREKQSGIRFGWRTKCLKFLICAKAKGILVQI